MYVPNYIPDPLEVPGNVTQQPYRLRLAFIRRVTAAHAMSVVVIVSLVALLPFEVTVGSALTWFGVLIGLLAVLRISIRGARIEAITSASALPLLCLSTALLVRSLPGVPWWSILVGLVVFWVYTALCGQDFSFVGAYLLSLTFSSVFIAIGCFWLNHRGTYAVIALAMNSAVLLYIVYDLASLLARRRLNEIGGAVVDLYRDIVNVFGYIPRVVRHWRKHRIWNDIPLDMSFLEVRNER